MFLVIEETQDISWNVAKWASVAQQYSDFTETPAAETGYDKLFRWKNETQHREETDTLIDLKARHYVFWL